MAFMLMQFEVEDFDGWKETFDSDPVGRKQIAKGHQIFRGVDNPSQVFVAEAGEQGNQLLRQASVQTVEVVAGIVSDEDARSEMDLVAKSLLEDPARIRAERERRALAIGALIDDDRLVLYRCMPGAGVHTISMRLRCP